MNILTSDAKIMHVDTEFIDESMTLKNIIEDLGECQELPLPKHYL